MSELSERLQDYMQALAGERLDLVSEKESKLPLFLRERYSLFSANLFGKKSLLALESKDWTGGSPAEYAKHAEILRQAFGQQTILVLSLLPSYARNRLVQMGISFVVPGSQTFIPNVLIDLRERFPLPNAKARTTLSPAAHCTVLYHLLREPLTGIPLREIAKKVHYSPIMLTKVKDELEAAGLCRVVRDGRSLVLEFEAAGRSLWQQASAYLASPVKRTRWVQWAAPGPPALLAGMSALSLRTMISDDRLRTYALPLVLFQDFLEKGVLTGCRDPESATAKIEVWSYHPQLLGDDQTVDPLSLYLSLRYSADERVEQQLEHLLEDIKW